MDIDRAAVLRNGDAKVSGPLALVLGDCSVRKAEPGDLGDPRQERIGSPVGSGAPACAGLQRAVDGDVAHREVSVSFRRVGQGLRCGGWLAAGCRRDGDYLVPAGDGCADWYAGG